MKRTTMLLIVGGAAIFAGAIGTTHFSDEQASPVVVTEQVDTNYPASSPSLESSKRVPNQPSVNQENNAANVRVEPVGAAHTASSEVSSLPSAAFDAESQAEVIGGSGMENLSEQAPEDTLDETRDLSKEGPEQFD